MADLSKIGFQVIAHFNPKKSVPKITVGIPTYKRKTLLRSLESLAKQTFRDFVVIISDNDWGSQLSYNITNQMKDLLPEIILVSQKKNLGIYGNKTFLVKYAKTEFFCWLADDDEISSNYLEELYKLLNKNNQISSACGKCKLLYDNKVNYFTPNYLSSSKKSIRIINFIFLSNYQFDDSFFYSLHRLKYLKKLSFNGYFFPNKNIFTNWCFVYLFELLLESPIIYSEKTELIMHVYTTKYYKRSIRAFSLIAKLKASARRINVYLYYCQKTILNSPIHLPLVFMLSLVGFFRDIKKSFKGYKNN